MTNEFAVKLQERINRFKDENNTDLIFPCSSSGAGE